MADPKIITCAFCNGTGRHPHFTGTCPVCKGRGKNQVIGRFMACSDCQGTGHKRGTTLTCWSCGGLGVLPDTREEFKKAREEIRKAQEEMEIERPARHRLSPKATSGGEEFREKSRNKENPTKESDEDTRFCQCCAKKVNKASTVKVCLKCFKKIKKAKGG